MAYTSNIDLGGIGEAPKTQDPENFADFSDVYNAIHILAQWVNMLYEHITKEDDELSGAPWETMPFERFFWAPAYHDIAQGDIVTIVDAARVKVYDEEGNESEVQVKGVVKGAALKYYNGDVQSGPLGPTTGGSWQSRGGFTGLAMEDAAAGELVKIGVGPAIVEVPGVTAGQVAVARQWGEWHNNYFPIGSPSNFSFITMHNDGGLYAPGDASDGGQYGGPPRLPGYVPVGIAVADGAMMLNPIYGEAGAYDIPVPTNGGWGDENSGSPGYGGQDPGYGQP